MSSNNKLAIWQIQAAQWWRYHAGLPALLAMLLAIAALVLAVRWLPNQQRDGLKQLQTEVAKLEAIRKGLAVPTAGDPAQVFVTGLPHSNEHLSDLKNLFLASIQSKLTLAKGEYAFQTDAGSPVTKLKATVPVLGNYVQIKKLLSIALTSTPNLALDALQIERQDTGQEQVIALIHLTYFYRNE
jgi:hypothetical protein